MSFRLFSAALSRNSYPTSCGRTTCRPRFDRVKERKFIRPFGSIVVTNSGDLVETVFRDRRLCVTRWTSRKLKARTSQRSVEDQRTDGNRVPVSRFQVPSRERRRTPTQMTAPSLSKFPARAARIYKPPSGRRVKCRAFECSEHRRLIEATRLARPTLEDEIA